MFYLIYLQVLTVPLISVLETMTTQIDIIKYVFKQLIILCQFSIKATMAFPENRRLILLLLLHITRLNEFLDSSQCFRMLQIK